MADECLFEVNERSDFPIAVTFLDEDGVAVVPDSATYRIDDVERRRVIQSSTPFPSLATTVDLWITSDQNHIIRSRSDYEIRTVTVEYNYISDAGAKHATAEYRYKLLNLHGVVDVPSPSVSPSASASPSA